MTLAEAEADSRFENFKFMSMIDLILYINRAEQFMERNPDDPDVPAFLEAAKLISKERST